VGPRISRAEGANHFSIGGKLDEIVCRVSRAENLIARLGAREFVTVLHGHRAIITLEGPIFNAAIAEFSLTHDLRVFLGGEANVGQHG